MMTKTGGKMMRKVSSKNASGPGLHPFRSEFRKSLRLKLFPGYNFKRNGFYVCHM